MLTVGVKYILHAACTGRLINSQFAQSVSLSVGVGGALHAHPFFLLFFSRHGRDRGAGSLTV